MGNITLLNQYNNTTTETTNQGMQQQKLSSIPTSNTPSSTATAVSTQLQDIKEEEDMDELRAMESHDLSNVTRVSTTHEEDGVSQLQQQISIAASSELSHSDSNKNLTMQDLKLLNNQIGSTEELTLLPPLPNVDELSRFTPNNMETSETNEPSFMNRFISSSNTTTTTTNNNAMDDNTFTLSDFNNTHKYPMQNVQIIENNLPENTDEVDGNSGNDDELNVEANLSVSHMINEEANNTSFDLSKALEIPSDNNNRSNSNNDHNEGNSNLASPKIPLTNRFSSTLLNQDLNTDNLNDGIFTPSHRKNNPSSNSVIRKSISNIRSQRDNSVEIRPIELSHLQDTSASIDRRESSSGMSNYSMTSEERIYKLPPMNPGTRNSIDKKQSQMSLRPVMTPVPLKEVGLSIGFPGINTLSDPAMTLSDSISMSSKHTAINESMMMIPPASDSNESTSSAKSSKMPPLLRRASSAILRKKSVKNLANNPTTPLTTAPPYELSLIHI